jgi:hypothetical protein
MSSENTNDICTKDLLAIVFLKTKYWGLFRDIEKNRDLYTQIRLYDKRAFLLWDDKEEQEYREKHFNDLFERLGYTDRDTELLRQILNDTLPGWHGDTSINEDQLRSTRRIGHRDLLDLYFSYGVSQQAYKERMQRVTPIVEHARKDTEKSLTRRFKDFNRYALKEESAGDIARLLSRQLIQLEDGSGLTVNVWRCWLRVLLQYESGANEATNSILASILSGANESIQRTLPLDTTDTPSVSQTIDYRVELARKLFEDIVDHLSDTYLALLVLLFVFPPRGNAFFLDYINRHGTEDLFLPVLSYVDNHYLTQKHSVFREYEWPYWSFVLYQWSLSISQGSINTSIPDAPQRHRNANDYVFNILGSDPKLTYRFIRDQFWSNEGWSSEKYQWRIESKIAQYDNKADYENILSVTKRAIAGKRLATTQKSELEEFLGDFQKYITRRSKETI